MSLETPIKIRMLQRKLYQKAKEEPGYRFYLLYDKMYREDILGHAYALVKSNQGAPGVDGQSFWGIESLGLEEWLSGIRDDLAISGASLLIPPQRRYDFLLNLDRAESFLGEVESRMLRRRSHVEAV